MNVKGSVHTLLMRSVEIIKVTFQRPRHKKENYLAPVRKKQTHARAGAALAQERNGSHLFKLKVTKRL